MAQQADAPATVLDPEMLEMVLETVERISRQLLPKETVLALDREERFPQEIIRNLLGPEIGLQLLFIPQEFGGMGGGTADGCTVTRAMASICLGVSTAFFAIQLGADPILVAGTDAQKEKWLGRIAAGEALVAYAATEPQAGSNLAAITTKAMPCKDEKGTDGYCITGSKQFISTGGYADFVTVLANTPQGPSFFIVEKGSPGFVPGKGEVKHGIRASNTSPIVFDQVFVPAENLVGLTPGLGLKQANAVFGRTRLMVGAMALGALDKVLSIAVPYAQTRIQFNSPLSQKQGYTHKLILPHWVAREAAAAFIEEVAARFDAGENDLETEASIAKYFASETANKAADDGMQALGGYGYMAEYEVEKIKRDVKITCIYEGTSEIQQNIIGMFRWKKNFKTKGGFYRDLAAQMEALDSRLPALGAGHIALAARACGSVISFMHEHKLTKKQASLFAAADMATHAEVGAALAKKAAARSDAGEDQHGMMADCSRIFARQVCSIVADRAIKAVFGPGLVSPEKTAAFMDDICFSGLIEASAGLFADMDELSGKVFI